MFYLVQSNKIRLHNQNECSVLRRPQPTAFPGYVAISNKMYYDSLVASFWRTALKSANEYAREPITKMMCVCLQCLHSTVVLYKYIYIQIYIYGTIFFFFFFYGQARSLCVIEKKKKEVSHTRGEITIYSQEETGQRKIWRRERRETTPVRQREGEIIKRMLWLQDTRQIKVVKMRL